jgi:hypothetical protein
MPLNNFEFSSDCAILDVGCYLKVWTGSQWLNADAFTDVVSGKFSDGTYCYTVSNGVITSKDLCGYTVTVYAKQINNSATITYDINTNPAGFGSLIENTDCEVKFTITQLQENDEVRFYNASSFAISGSLSDCPASPVDCDYTIIIGTSDVNVYLTVDGSNSC